MRRLAIIIGCLYMGAGSLLTSTARAAELHVPEQFASIPAAITAATDGDVILVAPGTYYGPVDFLGKAVHVLATQGYTQTILTVSEPGSVVIFRSGESAASKLEGFQITGGTGTQVVSTLYGGGIFVQASSPCIVSNLIFTNTANHGGGIACIQGAAPVIRANEVLLNGTFHGNAMPISGGGIYVEGSSPQIEANIIENNQASVAGGGIATDAGSSVKLHENTIRRNHAGPASSMGGGIACRGASMIEITDNRVLDNGADIGAGIFVGEGATANIIANTIEDNITNVVGGGVAFVADAGSFLQGNIIRGNNAQQGAGVYTQETNATISDNVITQHNNSLASGAAIACARGSNVRILSNDINENSAAVGAGIWISEKSTVEIERNRIRRNFSVREGAGIYCHDSSAVISGNEIVANGTRRASGAGLFLSLASSTLTNNTIAGNFAEAPDPDTTSGGGIYMFDSTVTLGNCIIWGNRAGTDAQIGSFAGSMNVSFSLIEGDWPGEANFDADPGFVDLAGTDTHLRSGSPCIDRGNSDAGAIPSRDTDGDARTIDGDDDGIPRVDIGADELRREIAARFGSVNARGGYLARVLRVNGQSGDVERTVRIPLRAPFSVSMLAPPAGPEIARFVLYAWPTEPDPSTVTLQPSGLGFTSLPTPINLGLGNQPEAIWNNLGHRPRLGRPDFESSPAPCTVLERLDGVSFPVIVTLQGFIQDLDSEAAVPLSTTNAVVIHIGD